MTPAEVAATLRQFNEWRRDFDNKIEQPDSREISEAIDAAVEMIDRLETAEQDALEQARLNGMGAERELALMAKLEAAEKERDECNSRRLEAADHFAAQTALMKEKCDALRAKIEQMERQEPVAWARKLGMDLPSPGCVTDLKYRPSDMPESAYMPLYALPGARPAPSIPDDVMRDAKRYRFLRAAKNIPISTEAARDPIVYDAAIDAAMLAAAPEAKP